MMSKTKDNSTKSTDSMRFILLAASIALFALILLGGMLRVVETGSACPDWPTCFGKFTPPVGNRALLDYLHRMATLVSGGLILLAAGLSRRRRSEDGDIQSIQDVGIRRPLIVAILLMAAQVLLGGGLALDLLPGDTAWASALHLALSLIVFAAVLAATVVSFYHAESGSAGLRTLFRSPVASLSLAELAATFLLLLSGAVVAASQVGDACPGWPLCGEAIIPVSPAGWLSLGHRLVVLGTSILVARALYKAWSTQRAQTPVITAATAAAVLFFAQALMGAKMMAEAPAYLLALHTATAVATWGAMVVQVVVVGMTGRVVKDKGVESISLRENRAASAVRMAKDLLMLTKPIVVVLLLVTTYAGMVIGKQEWPPFWLAFWTLLGGFMAAGGSGAINQYIDRYDDTRMQRTQKRPIPSGRLTPGEGLAFGVGMALASFYVMAALVNFLAALLSLAGIIYYVLIYSIFLKKATVQNIVIGGGAGAIPPLVGWAAATGGLNIPSLFLFAVVFMWTPPHFWALALVRRNDYARAGVPMLPVVRGETETRWQIFLYTMELVGLTLLLPLFGLGGSLYLIGAGLLGAWLLLAAWKVWKQGGNKLAWKMYRYSSMYLAFLFVVLMVDALVG